MCSAEQSSAYCHYFLFFGRHNHSISIPRGEYGQYQPLGVNTDKYSTLIQYCGAKKHEIICALWLFGPCSMIDTESYIPCIYFCIPNLAELRCRYNAWPCKGLSGSTLECWVTGCLACWAPLSARSRIQTRFDLWHCLDPVPGWILMWRGSSCTLATAASTDFYPCIRRGNLILTEGPCLLMTLQTYHCVGRSGVISWGAWKVSKAIFAQDHSSLSEWLVVLPFNWSGELPWI